MRIRDRERRQAGHAGAWLLGGALLFSAPAGALPEQGEKLPGFSAKDLEGKAHQSHELSGRPTLLVVITDKDAGDEMKRWFDTADQQVPPAVHRASILTFKLPFFVGEGAARERARARVPRQFWDDTWLDKNGDMGKALALPTSRTPYAIALDADGRVIAVAHATANTPEAREVLKALVGAERREP
ncbi:hypothetical protein LZ198_08485 [Myxococcus sp. K15C18031901]|uniref:hypothetical protein n=1 Tax=Myxococcus dinghuensis TaxID=2906761 RepID=UPI0020A805D5|nr:hypothetical protein [Myxococcus dinghuensis]MCP3098911.1 hypothetical protein [Myxococcus dinghuensis]